MKPSVSLAVVFMATCGRLRAVSSFLPTTIGSQINSNRNLPAFTSTPAQYNKQLLSIRGGNDNTTNNETAITPETTLYDEMRDMAALSFLVYTFAYAMDVARTEGLKGLHVSETGKVSASRALTRSFTPMEIWDIVRENRDVLRQKYEFAFGETLEYELLVKNLKTMQERIEQFTEASSSDTNKLNFRPLTLEEFDDKHQSHEMVYACTKDDINKRITLVFRGTENELSMISNWKTNLYMTQSRAEVPTVLAENKVVQKLDIHSGFLNYVFSPTVDPTDDTTFRKYDEILQDTKELLAANPGYQLYVTGHSLDIPKPVTCISFASPRVGDKNFLEASRWLEKEGLLRMLRAVNDKDSVAHFPVFNYKHVGFQARMFRGVDRDPSISYPKKSEGWDWDIRRKLENSFLLSFNLGYDHGDYRERVDKDEAFLQQLDWNKLYKDPTYTGFSEQE